jgi:hypothetical protein
VVAHTKYLAHLVQCQRPNRNALKEEKHRYLSLSLRFLHDGMTIKFSIACYNLASTKLGGRDNILSNVIAYDGIIFYCYSKALKSRRLLSQDSTYEGNRKRHKFPLVTRHATSLSKVSYEDNIFYLCEIESLAIQQRAIYTISTFLLRSLRTRRFCLYLSCSCSVHSIKAVVILTIKNVHNQENDCRNFYKLPNLTTPLCNAVPDLIDRYA